MSIPINAFYFPDGLKKEEREKYIEIRVEKK